MTDGCSRCDGPHKGPERRHYGRSAQGLDKIEVIGTDVLVGHYVRPEKTRGGIILAEKGMRDEEQYQGKAALVLKKGPRAFVKDSTHDWGDVVPQVGDWIAIWTSENQHPLELGGRRCRLVEDVNCKLILPRPDIVY